MFRPMRWIGSTITALALTLATTAAPVYAGGPQHGYNKGGHHGYYKGAHRGYNKGYAKGYHRGKHAGFKRGYHHKGYSKHYYKPHRYNRYNRHHFRGHYSGHYYGHHHRHGLGKTGAAILGVGLGLTTLAILNNNRRDYDNDRTVVIDRRPVTVVQEPAYNPNLPPAANASNCLQTREYQTVVIIGGVEREAYGTACLQPDGAWLRGPVQIAPDY